MPESRWYIICRFQKPRQTLPQPYIWDCFTKSWVRKHKALEIPNAYDVLYWTREEAEADAFLLSTKKPEIIGKVRVEEYSCLA